MSDEQKKPKTDKYAYVVFKENTYDVAASFTSKIAWAEWISNNQNGYTTVKVKL